MQIAVVSDQEVRVIKDVEGFSPELQVKFVRKCEGSGK
jgi:hypothetical protein